MSHQLDLDMFRDEGFRFNDNITPAMSDEELRQYLLSSAKEWNNSREPEVAYGILRELVWRAPNWSAEGWLLLARTAEALGKNEEAKSARRNYHVLSRTSAK